MTRSTKDQVIDVRLEGSSLTVWAARPRGCTVGAGSTHKLGPWTCGDARRDYFCSSILRAMASQRQTSQGRPVLFILAITVARQNDYYRTSIKREKDLSPDLAKEFSVSLYLRHVIHL